MSKKSVFKRVADLVRTVIRQCREPLRLEFILTDYCNLNCRGCTHYSPLAAKEFAPLETLERDMSQLSAVAGKKVQTVYLIGGETLLYPQLPEAMQLARRYFPTQRLHIFTNGLLLGKMSDKFWEVVRQTGTVISITRYPVKFDYDKALDVCHAHGAETEVFGDRSMANSFFRFGLDPRKGQNARLSHLKCYNFGCVSVTDGRVYPCSMSACVGHLNKACGTDFRHEHGDYIEVDKVNSASQILRLRNHPTPFCAYCRYPVDVVAYAPSRRDPAEWVDCPD